MTTPRTTTRGMIRVRITPTKSVEYDRMTNTITDIAGTRHVCRKDYTAEDFGNWVHRIINALNN